MAGHLHGSPPCVHSDFTVAADSRHMAWIPTSVLSFGAIAAAALTAVPISQPPDRADPPSIVVTGDAAHAELVNAVARRFQDAGLLLHSVSVTFHPTRDHCDGALGRHRHIGAQSHVEVCAGTDADATLHRYVIAHEFGHAWVETTLDDEARDHFLAHRRLTDWDGDEIPWSRRGSEHAAEIIARGVLRDVLEATAIRDTSCAPLLAGYFQLTGRFPDDPGACQAS